MTYEEYKNSKNKNTKTSIIKKLLSKIFSLIIFTLIIMTICNFSPKFKNFIINNVLNSTMDFSKFNNLMDNFSSTFKKEELQSVSKTEVKNKEKYLDGVKYFVHENENVYLKDSGIVTFIGQKDGYNNTIIIQQSNGYYAWYGNIKESVKLYDYVEKGSILGTASN